MSYLKCYKSIQIYLVNRLRLLSPTPSSIASRRFTSKRQVSFLCCSTGNMLCFYFRWAFKLSLVAVFRRRELMCHLSVHLCRCWRGEGLTLSPYIPHTLHQGMAQQGNKVYSPSRSLAYVIKLKQTFKHWSLTAKLFRSHLVKLVENDVFCFDISVRYMSGVPSRRRQTGVVDCKSSGYLHGPLDQCTDATIPSLHLHDETLTYKHDITVGDLYLSSCVCSSNLCTSFGFFLVDIDSVRCLVTVVH